MPCRVGAQRRPSNRRRQSEWSVPAVLTTQQVAKLLQLNVDYVRRLTREGVIPAYQLPGGREFRYIEQEILFWLQEHRYVAPGGGRLGDK